MSSDFSEFLNQPFIAGMLLLMGSVFLLLVATIAALMFVRRRKAQQKAAEAARAAANGNPASEAFNALNTNPMDMPDLALLVHNNNPAPAPAPKPTPQSAAVPAPPAPGPAAPSRAARKGTFSVTPKDGGTTEAVEVLTILRDVVDGKLIIQMGEKTYENVNSDPEFRERFGKLMREVGQMVNKSPAVAPVQTAPAITQAPVEEASEPEAVLPEPTPSPSVALNEPDFLAPKKAAPPPAAFNGKMPGDLPSFKLDDNPMQKLKRGRKVDLPPVPEINIAGAIEAYLQHKLTFTPEYANRSIHIYPAPGGGVKIEVDGQFYEAVSDVTDEPVREFLATTISEWQDRH